MLKIILFLLCFNLFSESILVYNLYNKNIENGYSELVTDFIIDVLNDKDMEVERLENVTDALAFFKDELEGMSMADFSNLVEKYDLGIETIDGMFYDVVHAIFEERSR